MLTPCTPILWVRGTVLGEMLHGKSLSRDCALTTLDMEDVEFVQSYALTPIGPLGA
jgi:hypothetical protein